MKQLMNKHVYVGAMKVYATNTIYSRIIGSQASKSTLNRHLREYFKSAYESEQQPQ